MSDTLSMEFKLTATGKLYFLEIHPTFEAAIRAEVRKFVATETVFPKVVSVNERDFQRELGEKTVPFSDRFDGNEFTYEVHPDKSVLRGHVLVYHPEPLERPRWSKEDLYD